LPEEGGAFGFKADDDRHNKQKRRQENQSGEGAGKIDIEFKRHIDAVGSKMSKRVF
jgi:hypothetical protein